MLEKFQVLAVGGLAVVLALMGCGDDGGSSSSKDGGLLEVGNVDDAGDAGNSDTGGNEDVNVGPETHRTETLLANETVTLALGRSGTVSFDVPDNAVSVTVIVEGEDRTSYVLGQWTDGTGYALVTNGWTNNDPFAPQICSTCDNRVVAAIGVFAAVAPNSQDAVLNPGTHTISVFGFDIMGFQGSPASGDATVTVVAKVIDDGLPDEGVIDFNMHFTGAGNWTADSAPGDPDFQEMLDGVASIYEQAGIRIGVVTYHDVDPNLSVIENILTDDSDLQMLFEQSAGNDREAVNLFFVEELAPLGSGQADGFAVLFGVSGGIPGPPLSQGTTRSGVAISVDAHDGGALSPPIENTVAHEVGHFLGLFHTSEQNNPLMPGPRLHDPLDDTPQDDSSYLMFNNPRGTTLSPWQQTIMRANAAIRH